MKPEDCILYTNNGAVVEFIKQRNVPIKVHYFTSPALEVLESLKIALNQGATLLSNPMAAGKIINPYLTVISSHPKENIDFKSIRQADEAIKIYKKNIKLRYISHSDEDVHRFQTIDLEYTVKILAQLLAQ